MVTWPIGLPTQPLAGTFSVEPVDDLVRGPADVGGGPRRPRYLGVVEIYRGTLDCSPEQVATLKAFHRYDCGKGAIAFDMNDWAAVQTVPATAEFTWHEPPKEKHRVGRLYDVQIVLAKLS